MRFLKAAFILLVPALGLLPLVVPPETVLPSLGSFLVVRDPPERADLIYLFGGNYSVRAPMAARLFRERWAPQIVLSREPEDVRSPSEPRGNFTDVTVDILRSEGVPADRILQLQPAGGVSSTADEARALRAFLQIHGVRRILVVTSNFHSRRALLALRRSLGSFIEIRMTPADDPTFTPRNWWRDAPGKIHCEEEYTRLVYYFFTFWG
jgi:uncharacterized SAM-binding protein YcdF (DUF218 family)